MLSPHGRFDHVWGAFTLDTLRFAASTAAASLTAMFLGLALQIDSPYWAATTVLIVAQRAPGQVVGKGLYRALGTVTGAVAAVVMVALFAQAPGPFTIALATWTAGCTYLSTILRGFRSYGAVLAGYTAAIVGLGAATAPDSAFDVAVSRAAGILLGILCGAVASAVLIPGRGREELLARLRGAIGTVADLFVAEAAREGASDRRRALIATLGDIEALGEAAGAEDLRLRRRMAGLGAALSEILTALASLRSAEEHRGRSPPQATPADAEDGSAWSDAAATAVRQALAEPLPAALARTTDAIDQGHAGIQPSIVGELRRDAGRALGRAVEAYAYLAGAGGPRPSARLGFHRDRAQALRNASRAFLAVNLAGALWIASAWSSGSAFVTNVCVACSLFATQPRPSAAAFGFMRGAGFAMVLAFGFKFFLLPWLNDFVLLAWALAPVLMLATLATAVPGWTGTATAFNVLFLTTIAPTNVMSYDPAAFLDSGFATLAAFVVGGTIFRVVLPANPERAARRLLINLRDDLRALLRGRRTTDLSRLRSEMYDRVVKVGALSCPPAFAGQALATLGVALDVLRLQAEHMPEDTRTAVRALLRRLADEQLAATDDRVTRLVETLAVADGPVGTVPFHRAAATLTAITEALAAHPAILQHEGSLA